MAKIELLFGGPITHEEEISVENYAYNWDTSIETAAIHPFRFWINHLVRRKNDDDDNFFELLLFIETNELMKLPKMSAGTYRHNGFVLPKLIIHGDCATDKESGETVFLTERYISAIAKGFEDEIGYEYFEFRHVGAVTAPRGGIIYLLGNQPHIFLSGRFYRAK